MLLCGGCAVAFSVCGWSGGRGGWPGAAEVRCAALCMLLVGAPMFSKSLPMLRTLRCTVQVLLDETVMQAGQLNEVGLRNLAVSHPYINNMRWSST